MKFKILLICLFIFILGVNLGFAQQSCYRVQNFDIDFQFKNRIIGIEATNVPLDIKITNRSPFTLYSSEIPFMYFIFSENLQKISSPYRKGNYHSVYNFSEMPNKAIAPQKSHIFTINLAKLDWGNISIDDYPTLKFRRLPTVNKYFQINYKQIKEARYVYKSPLKKKKARPKSKIKERKMDPNKELILIKKGNRYVLVEREKKKDMTSDKVINKRIAYSPTGVCRYKYKSSRSSVTAVNIK